VRGIAVERYALVGENQEPRNKLSIDLLWFNGLSAETRKIESLVNSRVFFALRLAHQPNNYLNVAVENRRLGPSNID